MFRISLRTYVVAWLACLAFVAAASAQAPLTDKKAESAKPESHGYVRVQRDAKDLPTALETAIVRFTTDKGEAGPFVDLVAAVHVGDKAYYQMLNKQFNGYDVVLYELVAPPGTRIPKGGQRDLGNPLSLLHLGMKSMLDLELQTERIDYTKPHFVHADLSMEQMREKMKERGEDGLTLALGFLADVLRQRNRGDAVPGIKPPKSLEEVDLAALLTDPDAPLKLKRVMAEQLGDPEAIGAGFGQAVNNLLIVDRNEAAIKALRAEMAKGHKKIAIFYGAAHMPDFEERLKRDFGMRRQDVKWLTAWDLE